MRQLLNRPWLATCSYGLASVALLLGGGAARAFPVDMGSPYVEAQLQTDLRYNVGMRMEKRNQAIANNATLFDESDYRFNNGDVVTNRIDATTGLDVTYNADTSWLDSLGLRVSGSAFHDFVYDDARTACRPGTAPVGVPPGLFGSTEVDLSYLDIPGVAQRVSYCDTRVTAYRDRELNSRARSRAHEDMEVLDAFVFGNFLAGEVPVSVKFGRHTLYWGESLLNPLIGVAYSMGPPDINKGLTVPGIGAQDVFLPLLRASATIGLLDSLSLGLDKPLEWEPLRSPEGGTYLAVADPLYEAPDQIYAGNLPLLGPTSLPQLPTQHGDNSDAFGVQLKWSPEFLRGATLGFYYRQFDEVVPALNLARATPERNPGLIGYAGALSNFLGGLGINLGPVGGDLPGAYRFTYSEGTKLYGLTGTTQLFGLSLGAEVVYNVDRTLTARLSQITEEGTGPRGDVWSGVLSALYLGKKVELFGLTLFDQYLLTTELNWSYLDHITYNAEAYKGMHSAACEADAVFFGAGEGHAETIDACASRYHLGLGLIFAPLWYQVLPGIDLAGQLFYSGGIKNNSPLQTVSNQDFIIASLGMTALIHSSYSVSLTYNYFDSKFRTGQNFDGEEVVTTFNGSGVIADRDWLSLTFKYSF